MNKKLTNKDIINGAKYCAEGSCGNCPLLEYRYGLEDCVKVFVNYILCNIKENETAPVATDTNSEVSVKEDTNLMHTNDNIKEQICQAYDTINEACGDIIDIYEVMSEREHRAFNIGEVYGKMCITRDKLRKLKSDDDK